MMLMHIDRVYRFPIWETALLVIGLSVLGAAIIELVARRVLPFEFRQDNNLVGGAMFSVVGVTFAVLLAFVAMLTLEGYTEARTATTAEAAVTRDVATTIAGFHEPARALLRNQLARYLHDTIEIEWPAQAAGHVSDAAAAPLARMDALAAAYQPAGTADGTYQAALVSALDHLHEARATRLLAAGGTVPTIVWTVMLVGGAMTVASSSFLGAPSARMHLVMSATLAASGAVVVVMIIVLSQPFRGDIRVSAEAFQQVLATLAPETAASAPPG